MPQARDEAGNIWNVDDQGNPVSLASAAPSRAPQMPADPAFQYKGPQAQADLQGRTVTTQGNAIDNEITQATKGSTITKAAADALTSQRNAQTAGLQNGQMWAPDGRSVVSIPGYVDPKAPPPKTDEDRASVRAEAVDKIKLARSLVDRSKNGWFTTGFGSGIAGSFKGSPAYDLAQDTDTLKNAGALTRIMEMSAQNGGKNPLTPLSNADFQALASSLSNLEPGQSDEQYQRNIQRVIDLYQRAYQGAGGTDLEGEIDPKRKRPDFIPLNQGSNPGGGSGGNGPGSVWQQTYGTAPTAPGAAPAGSTTQAQSIDPRMQAELDAYFQQQGRRLDERGLSRFVTDLYARYGGTPGPGLDTYAQSTIKALRDGGQIDTNIPAQTVPLTGLDRLRNDVVNNPVGAGVVGFGDALGMGAVSALAGDDVRALGSASTGNTLGMMAGQIAGSVAGTRGLGMMGRASIGRAAPSLLGGGGRAQFARDLGTDAVYSGIYGTAQGQDPLTSVALGVGGSLAGRGVTGALGSVAGGLSRTAAADVLRARGIPTTVGQSLGGFVKSAEDALTSAPIIGDIINARRLEGVRAFNQAAMNEAGAPIGATVGDVGQAGVADLRRQVGDAYNTATAGVNVPLDARLNTDLSDIARASRSLPSDYQGPFNAIGESRIGPLIDRGAMSGDDYQQALRGLRAARRNANQVGNTGFEQEYRDLLTDTMGALEGNMRRGGGASVVEGLDAANAANRNVATIEDATRRAAGGSGSGENFLFTPSQLQRAGLATESRFPGARPMADLADAGQQALPSRIPDSGTARRVAQFALPAALGGSGAAYGGLTGGADGAQSGALTGLALAAALGLGGTRGGQQALDNAIFVRPDAIRRAGQAITARRGMFGRGLIPVALRLGAAQ